MCICVWASVYFVLELPSRYSMQPLFYVLGFISESWWRLSSRLHVSGNKNWWTQMAVSAKRGVFIFLKFHSKWLEYNRFSTQDELIHSSTEQSKAECSDLVQSVLLGLMSIPPFALRPPHAFLRFKFAYFQTVALKNIHKSI